MRLCLFAFLLVPFAAFGASREIVELQRDVSALQDQVRALQSSQTEKLTAMSVLLQQTLEATNNAVKAMTVLETRVADRLDKQSASVGQPVAVIGTKVDQMSGEFQSVRESINDISSRIGKLEQKIVDLGNAFRTMQAPPAAPSPTGVSGAPAIPAQTLYDTAMRDRMSGKPDLALKGFADYIQMYGETELAANAYYQSGEIRFQQGDLPNAVKDFDAVLEKYSSSNKTPEAMYMKGKTLVRMGRKTDGQKEFRAVLATYPRSDVAPKACSELKALGYSCAAPASAIRKKGE
jgi:TolA-binding protein